MNLDQDNADEPLSSAKATVGLRTCRFGIIALAGAVFATQTPAAAQEAEQARQTEKPKPKDALPGSPRPPGVGLSPEAPPTPPAPGGRAPSFGAPLAPEVWSFRFGGKILAYQSLGIGERTAPTRPGQSDTPFHTPPFTEGRRPFDASASLTLNLSYGNAVVGAFVDYTVASTGKEREGLYHATKGAAANTAYILVTPQALGNLRLQAKIGALNDSYAGTGQWGWGLLGPLVAVRGYGETITGEYDVSSSVRLFFSHGIAGVPGVPEYFVRGNYVGWNETGVSSVLQHAHVGIAYRGKYNLKLHAVNVTGTDERTGLAPIDPTQNPTAVPLNPDGQLPAGLCPAGQAVLAVGGSLGEGNTGYWCPSPRDGRIDVFALETHTFLDQWGQLGVSAAYYNLVSAESVHDGIWWGIDWTQGGREMTSKYLGRYSGGSGKIVAVSAQYDFSLASVLWHPESFDGRGPDVRVALAGIYHFTVDAAEEEAEGARGYQVALDTEYRMLPWLSSTLRMYGTSRDGYAVLSAEQSGQGQAITYVGQKFGHPRVFTLTPGLLFRSDWQAPERIEIAYTRHFYNDDVDNNPARPLDTDVVTIGGAISF